MGTLHPLRPTRPGSPAALTIHHADPVPRTAGRRRPSSDDLARRVCVHDDLDRRADELARVGVGNLSMEHLTSHLRRYADRLDAETAAGRGQAEDAIAVAAAAQLLLERNLREDAR